MTRAFAIVLMLFAAVLGVCLVRYAAPSALPADAPLDRFSAGRAREVQRTIAAEGISRSIGSEANAKARTYLEAELVKSGFATEGLQEVFRFLSARMGIGEVKAWIDTRNLASIALVEKLGLQRVERIENADHFKGTRSDEFVFFRVL